MISLNAVSVITPNFNGERFLRRVIESVRLQNYPLEHIIVDDCSTDNSWDLLIQLAADYSWLKPVRLDKNSGPVEARNKAIEIAQGRFIAFLDVDDFWLSHKLSTHVNFMIEKNCAFSFSDYRFVSEDGKKIGRRLKGFDRVGWHLHHMTRYLGCLTIIIDISKIPNFRFKNISPAYRAEDFLAWSYCISTAGPALRCPHDLSRYSVVKNSRSSNAIKSSISVWKLYRYIERISFTSSALYFFIYSSVVIWKRYWFRPYIDRFIIDLEDDWSILH